jgi:ribosome-binding protein aMBF1 (putative translation factor)
MRRVRCQDHAWFDDEPGNILDRCRCALSRVDGAAGEAALVPASESDFLEHVDERVRAMRSLRDMSRRELARRSKISERYLAMIEAGKGDVSIVLLLRIAHAVRGD